MVLICQPQPRGLNAKEVLCSIAVLCVVCVRSHEQRGSKPISSI